MKSLRFVLMAFALVSTVSAATVTPDTLRRWNEYVQWSRMELANAASHRDSFLTVESKPRELQKVHSGAILATRDQPAGMVSVPYGLIHNWVGTVFIPNSDLRSALAVMEDYSGYVEMYSPGVASSKLLSSAPEEYLYQLEFREKRFGIKVGLAGEFRTRYVQLDAATGYSVTETVDLYETENSGTPQERRLSLAASRGYVENMFTVVRYHQRDGGVYVQVETMTLSRDIPAAVRWFVGPIVQRFARETMTDTLTRLRKRVLETSSLDAARSRNPVRP